MPNGCPFSSIRHFSRIIRFRRDAPTSDARFHGRDLGRKSFIQSVPTSRFRSRAPLLKSDRFLSFLLGRALPLRVTVDPYVSLVRHVLFSKPVGRCTARLSRRAPTLRFGEGMSHRRTFHEGATFSTEPVRHK